MTFTRCLLVACLGILFFGSDLNAQQLASSPSSEVVPRLVNFSGNATDVHGKAISGIAGATFAIYKDQYEGAPLWMETQNVHADTDGHYSVQLGATKSEGMPLELFTTPEARWLGVRINGGEEQPRVLLVSVPYALKAADAETLGGKPLSAFQLAPVESNNNARSQEVQPTVTDQPFEITCANGTACKTGFIPQFSTNGGSAKVTDSIITRSGSTIGIAGNETVTGSVSARTVSGMLGVTGISPNGNPAVSGTNSSSGYGVFGTSSIEPAIWGENTGTTGGIADGVHGVANSANSSGVAGVNVAGGIGIYGTGGTGVFGTGSSFGFATDSNAQQARTAGGWVKAMVYINGEVSPPSIVGCFNSTLAGAAASTPPCGFTVKGVGSGLYDVDFGFTVIDRFYSATLGFTTGSTNPTIKAVPSSAFETQVDVGIADTNFNGSPSYFTLIVF